MIRFILFLLIFYVVYAFYQKTKNTQIGSKVNDLGTDIVFPKSSCPSPKTFMDYTEGKIKGKKKEAIDHHISHCKNCQDALNVVFGMTAG
ncbi:MAG: hypothetical protein ABH862_01140 [Candidatus Omnitrophota bacterium]